MSDRAVRIWKLIGVCVVLGAIFITFLGTKVDFLEFPGADNILVPPILGSTWPIKVSFLYSATWLGSAAISGIGVLIIVFSTLKKVFAR